jgi:hypothetical protein
VADWPEYKERILVKMRDRGMTASEIAKAMGTTRNAIIGKMDRMGLLRRRPDRPTRAQRSAEGFVPKQPPSPPRQFSWQV